MSVTILEIIVASNRTSEYFSQNIADTTKNQISLQDA